MWSEGKKTSRGGIRPGAGRPKGAVDKVPRKRGPKTSSRMVTMRAEIWEMVDATIAARGTTRPEFFEAAVLAEIDRGDR